MERFRQDVRRVLRGAGRAVAVGALLAAVWLPATDAAAIGASGLFRSVEKRGKSVRTFKKWYGVLGRIEIEREIENRPCTARGFNRCHLRQWKAFLAGLRGMDRMSQLRAVNRFANRWRYVEDIVNYGILDYWATPRQFFNRNGDCEDYAITKYMSLRYLGWPVQSLRIVVLQDDNLRVAHAVLAAYVGGRAFILDNQIKQVVHHSRIWHYRPIYSLNETAWWFHRPVR